MWATDCCGSAAITLITVKEQQRVKKITDIKPHRRHTQIDQPYLPGDANVHSHLIHIVTWTHIQCCDLDTMVLKLECTRIYLAKVLVSRPWWQGFALGVEIFNKVLTTTLHASRSVQPFCQVHIDNATCYIGIQCGLIMIIMTGYWQHSGQRSLLPSAKSEMSTNRWRHRVCSAQTP